MLGGFPPPLIPALQNIGILHHKKEKLRILLQQSVHCLFFQIAKLALYKEFEAAKLAKEEAIKNSELLEQQSRTLREKLAIALEKKNKFEAKEFNQKKNIDMATSDLKVTKRELKDKENYLNQLSDQLMLRQSDISDYQAQIQVDIRYL